MISDHIQSYYRTERISSVVLSAVGATASTFGLAGYFFFSKSEISLGLLLGLCLVGSYQIIVGLVRLYRSRRRYRSAIEDVESNTSFISESEYPRLQKKETLIHQMRKIELSVVILSIIGMVVFMATPINNHVIGTIAGLCFHAGFLLCFDLFSQFRIKEYIYQIEKYLKS